MSDNDVLICIKALLADAKPPITDDCCIYRVPNDIREVNVDACIPKCISIGPLHHNDQRLQNMERYKRFYFKQFVARTNTKLEDLISFVKDVEPRLRRCYSEKLEMSTNELVQVILLDACFLVELIYSACHDEMTDDERTMLNDQLINCICLDLLRLENQVPFFILEKLYNLAFASQSPSFLKLSTQFFKKYCKQELEHDFTISHFTDLIRTFYLQHPSPSRATSYYKHIRTASAFKEAGVMF